VQPEPRMVFFSQVDAKQRQDLDWLFE
jgi:hypothetical protein